MVRGRDRGGGKRSIVGGADFVGGNIDFEEFARGQSAGACVSGEEDRVCEMAGLEGE